MISILLALLLLSALRRCAAWFWPRAWLAIMLAAVAGCPVLPSSPAYGFPEHRIHPDESPPQRNEEQRDRAEFLAAHQRWLQKDFKGCREQLEILLARNPAHCEARLLLADLFLSTGQAQAALVQVQAALKYHAENADVQYDMGLTLDVNGRPDEALACYERASKMAPTNNTYLLSYRSAREAAARRAARQSAATAVTESSAGGQGAVLPEVAPLPAPPQPLSTADNSPLPHSREGHVATVASAKAQSWSGTGSKVVPASSNVEDRSSEYLAKGREAMNGGLPELAGALFRKAVASRPEDPQIPAAAAVCALRHQEAKLALDLLTPAGQRFPHSAAVFRCLGTAHLQTGDYLAAQKDLEQALLLDQSSAVSYYLMGCTMTRLGQVEAAGANFRKAQALDPRYVVRFRLTSE